MSANAEREPARNTGPKVLRVGIIQNGKIIEERLLRKPGPITVGSDPRATFHVPAAELPASFLMFEHKGGQYHLCFDEKMEGRISLGDAAHDLASLRKGGKATKVGANYQVAIHDRSRGKVVLGDTTVLFQFVVPPPVAKPELPVAMRNGILGSMDWNLVIALLLSTLLQGGSLSWVQSQDWPEPRDIKALPDRFVKILAPPVAEKELEKTDEKVELEKIDGEDSKEPTEKPKEEKAPPKVVNNTPKPADPDRAAADEANRKKALSKSVENKTILKQLGSVGDGGGSIVDALAGGADRRNLDDAFAGSTGVEKGSASGAERSGIHRVGASDATGSGRASGIGDLKGPKGAEEAKGAVDTGEKTEAEKVKSNISIRGSGETTSGSGKMDKTQLSAVFRAREGALRSCYERELKKNPSLGGKLTVKFTIGGAGRVTSASVTKHLDGSSAVGECVVSRIQTWKFPSPEGGDVTVSKSIVFSAGQ